MSAKKPVPKKRKDVSRKRKVVLKPTPKNKTSKRARRVAIAKGLVEQKTPKQLAQQLGVSRKTVYEELRQPETQELIRRWMEPYHDQVKAMIPRAILALSRKFDVAETGLVFDTLDMLRCIRSLGMIMTWAQGKPTDGDENPINRRFSGTMEELLVCYRRLTAGDAGGGETAGEGSSLSSENS